MIQLNHKLSEHDREVVVLVHGLGANRFMLKPIESHLNRSGFATLNWGYPSIWKDIEHHAGRLSERIESLAQSSQIKTIRLVTHSMGGIVARTMLARQCFRKLQTMVMLAPPNHGSRTAAQLAKGLGWLCKPLVQLSDENRSFVNDLPVPDRLAIGIIAAERDRVISVDSTHLPTETDHFTVPSGHNSMLFRRDVAQQVATFLRKGRFQP